MLNHEREMAGVLADAAKQSLNLTDAMKHSKNIISRKAKYLDAMGYESGSVSYSKEVVATMTDLVSLLDVIAVLESESGQETQVAELKGIKEKIATFVQKANEESILDAIQQWIQTQWCGDIGSGFNYKDSDSSIIGSDMWNRAMLSGILFFISLAWPLLPLTAIPYQKTPWAM